MIQHAIRTIDRWIGKVQGKGGSPNCANEVAALARLANFDNPTIIDGGANKGDWTAAAQAFWPSGAYFLFEPSPQNQDILRKRFSGVEIIGDALSDRSGRAELYANFEGSTLASLHKRSLEHHNIAHEKVADINTTTIDEFCKSRHLEKIDILKLDIEGHELQALRGALFILPKTKLIQFEMGGCNIDSRTFFRDFWQLLSPLGFSIYRITPFGPKKINTYTEQQESFLTNNYIANNQTIT